MAKEKQPIVNKTINEMKYSSDERIIPVESRNLTDGLDPNETSFALGNGDVMNLAHPNAERDLTSMLAVQSAANIKLDSLAKNTGIYEQANRTLYNLLSKVTFTSGAFCLGVGAICSDWDLFQKGLLMALPAVAYQVGRYDEARLPAIQQDLLLKKVRGYQK